MIRTISILIAVLLATVAIWTVGIAKADDAIEQEMKAHPGKSFDFDMHKDGTTTWTEQQH